MTAEQIKAIIDDGEYWFYGLRADREGLEVGHEFDNSHQWWQDDPEDGSEYNDDMGCWDGGELDGVCTIGITNATVDGIEDAMKRMRMYSNSGKSLYLVGGDSAEDGNDTDELIISEGKVIAVIR